MNARYRGSSPSRASPRADRTRSALVTAAWALFAERGVEATAVDDITDAARVAKGTFYVHFRRKHDVLLEHASSRIDAVGEVGAAGVSAAEAVAALCGRLAAAFAQVPAALRVPMARELRCDPDGWARVAGPPRTLAGRVAALVARGQAAGELRGDQPAEALARRLAALLIDALGATPPQATAEELLDELSAAASLFLQGAAAPGSAATAVSRTR